MSSPEAPTPHNGNEADVDESPLIMTWRMFGCDATTFAGYKALSADATKRLMEGGEPGPGEELFGPYLKAVGEMTGITIPTQTIIPEPIV